MGWYSLVQRHLTCQAGNTDGLVTIHPRKEPLMIVPNYTLTIVLSSREDSFSEVKNSIRNKPERRLRNNTSRKSGMRKGITAFHSRQFLPLCNSKQQGRGYHIQKSRVLRDFARRRLQYCYLVVGYTNGPPHKTQSRSRSNLLRSSSELRTPRPPR